MVRKMLILICLLGLVFVVQLPLSSCQNTGYECGGESSCTNATDQQTQQNHHPAAADREKVDSKSTSFIDYINVGDGARKCLEIARRIWNTNRALKLYLLRDENNDSFVEFRFAKKDGKDDTASDDIDYQQNEVGRTFGIRRRMQLFLWLPISFKLGVIVTLLLVLTTMSLKTLIIGFIILLLLLTRTNVGPAKLWGAQRHAELADVHRNVHIHVHTLPEDPFQHQAYAAAASEPWQNSQSFAVQHVR